MEEDSAMEEPAMPDSAMMDANIDDLFGEAADGMATDGLGLPMPSAPLPPSLLLRIAEMQGRGCCTKLAWGSTGSIAQVSNDGRKVNFRSLIRHEQTGVWSLSEESKHSLSAPEGTIWEHIQFSGNGLELAVIDSLGSVHAYTLLGALGRMFTPPSHGDGTETSRSNLDAVVGMHWLLISPYDFKVPYIPHAHKSGEKWGTGALRHRDPNELPLHHAVDGRNALFYVSRNAKLTLMYQIETSWHSISSRLESIDSSNEILTHAAMGEEGDHVLLITHDLSKRFRLYQIAITWNPSQRPRAPGQPPINLVEPTMDISHLTVLDNVAAQHVDAAKLSQLHFMPAIPSFAADSNGPTFPTVLAMFTRASLPSDSNQLQQEAFSIIARWHVESVTPTLHEAFSKLKVNGNIAPSQTQVSLLRRQEDIITSKIVLSVDPWYYYTMLAFTASDATIEFRERSTMASVEPSVDTTTASGLPQAGFEHTMGNHSAHVAMSTDGSALVTLKRDLTLTHKAMALRYSWQPVEDGISNSLIEAAVVCLARQYAILACMSAVSEDDTLALMPLDLSTEMRSLFIKQAIIMTNRAIDIPMQDFNRQQGLVIKEPLLARIISAQLVLGCKPGSAERTFAGKFAFAFLNMKLVCNPLVQFVTHQSIFLKPDYLGSMRGMIKWASDLMVYVADGITSAKRTSDPSSSPSAKQVLEDHLESSDSPVVNLLICTFTRIYLRFLAGHIPKYLNGVRQVMPHARSVLERQQLAEIIEMENSMPFKYADFEALIAEFDAAIRDVYTQVPHERRHDIELAAICDSSLPDELSPAFETLLDSVLPKFMAKADMGKLYFRDTSWLGIIPTPKSQRYDVIRKLPLTKGMPLRVCKRCGSKVEDLSIEKMKELPLWIMPQQRHCVCTNYWILDVEQV